MRLISKYIKNLYISTAKKPNNSIEKWAKGINNKSYCIAQGTIFNIL